jgi:uncharacterized protein
MFELQVISAVDGGPFPEGPRILYRPNAGLAFVGNRAMAAVAEAASRGKVLPDFPDAVAFLRRLGFLAPDPPVPSISAETSSESDYRPVRAVLLLTNQCQLRCLYCYANAGEEPVDTIETVVARSAIDHVCTTAMARGQARFDLCLHGGGEPTLAWAPLRASVEHARSMPLPAVITMTTNGVWAGGRLDWLTRQLDSITLSVDGAPTTQDRQRPLASGRPSSPLVLRTATELDRRGFPYALRLTAVQPFDRLPEDVRYLCGVTRCGQLQVEPVMYGRRGDQTAVPAAGSSAARSAGQFAGQFAASFAAAWRVAHDAGRQLLFSGARLDGPVAVHCSAPYDSLIVTTAGRLVTCYEVTGPGHPLARLSTIGRVTGGTVVVDEEARRMLLRRLEERRAGCDGCWCRRTCAGDCYVRAIRPGDRGHLHRGLRCDLNRAVSRALLLELIAAGGGVWRRDGHRGPA